MNPIRKVIKKGLQTGGFTLFELMVAMVILAVGLFAIVQLGVVSVRGNGYARERVEAMQIAMGIANEIKTMGSEFIDKKIGTNDLFADQFPAITVSATPNPGQPMNIADLRAWQTYLSSGGVRNDIADGITPIDAFKINSDGQVAGCGDLTCARAIYRVHYIAYKIKLIQGKNLPESADIYRITLFVSWDSKDYGEKDYDWENGGWWNNGVDFWKRHMVVVPIEIYRRRGW